ncbi:hypothetical protein [Aliarcobacter lanthieri]|uniref:hypothetical protein n=1 Tax=Aliarcobacter lanthieri TaxID=1355374 RepID=UPI0004791BC2|nr:hypothetical protein [Aliarcobacter lanthieri]
MKKKEKNQEINTIKDISKNNNSELELEHNLDSEIGEYEILKKEQQKKEQETEKHNAIYDELEPISNNAFTKVLFTATNELDFENLKKSLQLGQLDENFDLDLKNLDTEYIKNAGDWSKVYPLPFLDEKFYREWFADGYDEPKDFILETPHLKIYNEKNDTLNLIIDDEKLSISLHLEDTHILGNKFASKNEYIQDKIKNIAKENSCELLLIHSEDRFADIVGENYSIGYIKNFDKDGKDITPEEIKKRNVYSHQREDNIEYFSRNVKYYTEREKEEDRNKFKESYSKTLEEQANSKSFKELLKEIKLDSIKDLAKDIIKRLGEDWNNPVVFLGEVKEAYKFNKEAFKDDVEKRKSIKKAFKPKEKQQSKSKDMER